MQNACAILYCHLWPLWLYHIVLPSVACLAVKYCIAICGLPGCTILYCHLWPVWLHNIVLPSVACLAAQYCIAICGLSGCKVLYCHLWPVWLYNIVLPSVACLLHIFPHYLINGTIFGHKLLSIIGGF